MYKWLLLCLLYCGQLNAANLYFGANLGLGATTWSALVPKRQNDALAISTPLESQEGGGVYGVFSGVRFGKNLSIELNYLKFPKAKLTFDEFSLYAFENNGRTTLETHTDAIYLLGKISLPLPKTHFEIYSGAGAAYVHRRDELFNHSRTSPAFSVGLGYAINEHIRAELSGIYIAGYGETDLNPVKLYMPFLYAGLFKLAYVI